MEGEELHMSKLTTEEVPLLHTALRVPSLVPGRWIYLRTWFVGSDKISAYRSCGSEIWNVYASHYAAGVSGEGLEPVTLVDRGRGCVTNHEAFVANMNALDSYLLSLGAEPVLSDEWPANGEGVGPREADRTPFRLDDWDAADVAMKALGFAGVCSRTPLRAV